MTIKILNNDIGFACYDAQTGKLLGWDEYGSDIIRFLKRLGRATDAFEVVDSVDELPPFNGEPPADNLYPVPP